jgi:hypothetical protein
VTETLRARLLKYTALDHWLPTHTNWQATDADQLDKINTVNDFRSALGSLLAHVGSVLQQRHDLVSMFQLYYAQWDKALRNPRLRNVRALLVADQVIRQSAEGHMIGEQLMCDPWLLECNPDPHVRQHIELALMGSEAELLRPVPSSKAGGRPAVPASPKQTPRHSASACWAFNGYTKFKQSEMDLCKLSANRCRNKRACLICSSDKHGQYGCDRYNIDKKEPWGQARK